MVGEVDSRDVLEAARVSTPSGPTVAIQTKASGSPGEVGEHPGGARDDRVAAGRWACRRRPPRRTRDRRSPVRSRSRATRIRLFFSACVYCGWVKICCEVVDSVSWLLVGRERAVDHHVERAAEEHGHEQQERAACPARAGPRPPDGGADAVPRRRGAAGSVTSIGVALPYLPMARRAPARLAIRRRRGGGLSHGRQDLGDAGTVGSSLSERPCRSCRLLAIAASSTGRAWPWRKLF